MWQFKILVKLIISILKIPYRMQRIAGIGKHTTNIEDKSKFLLSNYIEPYQKSFNKSDYILLELGPGDSATVLNYCLHHELSYISVDTGFFNKKDINRLDSSKDIINVSSDYDPNMRINVLTGGSISLERLPSGTINYVFSNAVLEHIWKKDLKTVLDHTIRVQCPGGIFKHRIDFKDHLSGGLKNQFFPDFLWESRLFRNASFYTNRKSSSYFIEFFNQKTKCKMVEFRGFEKQLSYMEIKSGKNNGWKEKDFLISSADFEGLKP
tara:strand:+ start:503 stop:1300 length:798 start_codon:yes stop_codon:yes gene_type:complete